MKKISVLVTFIAVLSMAACGSVADSGNFGNDQSANTTAYTSGLPAIQLINAKTAITRSGLSGSYTAQLAGDIELENIAYTKTVKVVYSVDNGSTWQEASATYVKSLGNNREHWKFSANVKSISQSGDPRSGYMGPKVTVQFALKYIVNGVTYWDNNGGIGVDYRVTTVEGGGTQTYAPAVFAKQNVVLTYVTHTDYPTTYLRGTVAVKKMGSSAGSVSVVYTTDHWATTHTVTSSTPMYTFTDSYVFYFLDPANTSYGPLTFEFAVAYDVNGQTYWDNNVGSNYKFSSGYTLPF